MNNLVQANSTTQIKWEEFQKVQGEIENFIALSLLKKLNF